MDWKAQFESALDYNAFLEKHAEQKDHDRWEEVLGKVTLTPTRPPSSPASSAA